MKFLFEFFFLSKHTIDLGFCGEEANCSYFMAETFDLKKKENSLALSPELRPRGLFESFCWILFEIYVLWAENPGQASRY